MFKNVIKKVVALGLVACFMVGVALMTPVAPSQCENVGPSARNIAPPEPLED